MQKLMIVGGSGLLGGHLARSAKEDYDVVATFNSHPVEIQGCRLIKMDITSKENTKHSIQKEQPDFVVLSAALRDVDYCEKNKKKATLVNVEGAINVAHASKLVNAKLIYLSTDMVFDGEKGHYTEEDAPNPKNHYGMTKFQGERAVSEITDNLAVARVSVLYHFNPFDHTTNFVQWLLENLKKGKSLSLFSDQFRCPTFVENANTALLKICQMNARGIFHIAGKKCVSRDQIGDTVAEVFGMPRGLISKTTSNQGNWYAFRPQKLCLDVSRMEKTLKVKSMDIKHGLLRMKEVYSVYNENKGQEYRVKTKST